MLKFGRSVDMSVMVVVEPLIGCLLGYLLFVAIAPRLMRNLPALQMRFPLVVYNVCMTCLCAYMFVEFLYVSTKLGYSYVCQPVGGAGRVGGRKG